MSTGELKTLNSTSDMVDLSVRETCQGDGMPPDTQVHHSGEHSGSGDVLIHPLVCYYLIFSFIR